MARPSQMIKRFLPKSLFGRSLMIIITPLILLQVVSTWIFFDRHWDTITRRLASSIAGDIAWILEGMSSDMSEKARAELFARARRHKGLQIILRPNQILPNRQASYGGILDSTMAHALQERVRKPFMLDTSSFKTRVVIDIQQAEGILTIVVPGKRLFSSTTYIFILWMVGTSLVLFAVASIFMRNQVRPIRRLAQAADAFGKGGEMVRTSEYKAHRRSGSPQPPSTACVNGSTVRSTANRHVIRCKPRSADTAHADEAATRNGAGIAEIEELKSDLSDMEKMIEGYLTFARGEGDEKGVEMSLSELVTEAVGA